MSIPDLLQPPRLDPAAAAELERAGATLLCMGMPMGTQFGLDYADWVVGSKFVGVKLIPPGAHFLWFSAVGKMGDFAPRTGFFFHAAASQVVVTRWDAATERVLQAHELPEEDVARLEAGVRRHEFDAGLGVYPLKTWSIWQSLTAHISVELLWRLTPVGGGTLTSTAAELASAGPPDTSAAAESSSESADAVAATRSVTVPPEAAASDGVDAVAASRLAIAARNLDIAAGEECPLRFSAIRGCGPGCTPADVTQFAMDTSFALQHLLTKTLKGDVNALLGKLQCSFIAFIHGQLLPAFEHWKRLLLCVCRSEHLLEQALAGSHALPASFYPQALGVIRAQFEVMPKDLFLDDITKKNFLVVCLQALHDTVVMTTTTPEHNPIASAVAALLSLCHARFGWSPRPLRRNAPQSFVVQGQSFPSDDPATAAASFGGQSEDDLEDDDEDGPVIVDLEASLY